jgi:hypothetical protein
MYLAVWINDREETPDRRICLCTPLLKRLNAAVALLQSRKRHDADSVILSGDQNQLNRFVELLDEADDDWLADRNDRLVDALTIVAAKAGCSVVPYGSVPDGVTSEMVRAAVKKMPKPGLYPRYITKEAKPIWDDVLEKYKKTLHQYKADKEKMWGAAILIFQRVAHAQQVRPFTRDFGQSHRGKIQTVTHRRINQGNFKALKAIENAAQMLAKQKLAGRLTNEKFYEAAHENGRYYITTFQALTTPDAKRAVQFLLGEHWGGGVPGQYAHRAVDMYTDVMAEPLGQKKLHFYIVTHLTRDLMEIMWPGLADKDKQTVLRTLGKAGRQWVKTGTMKAVASTDRTLTVHLNERKARSIVERVLKRLGETYLYRTRAELRVMGYPSHYGPQVHVLDTRLTAVELEGLIMEEAVSRGLGSLGFEVVD